MAGYRREWMRRSPRRDNRMLDGSLLISQRGGAAFFASGVIYRREFLSETRRALL